jgi:FAD/FMN-containing dehydrogenase
MLPGGEIARCSRDTHADLFRATCGGMGLTGVIVSARFRLQRVDSAMIDQTVVRARNLGHILELFDEYAGWTYSVAWIDCLARGQAMGRSLLMVGEHARDHDLRLPRGPRLTVPVDLPSCTLNRYSVLAFNALYYGRMRQDLVRNRASIDGFFYPLDAVHDWNRIYGRSGFTQYQFVLPREGGAEGMAEVLRRISASGLGSFLAVLKLFGPENGNPLSFPREGYTLALDFRIEPRLFPLLDALDAVVLDHGGRLYLTKDVRMSPDTLARGYPRLDEFRAVRRRHGLEGAFESLQSKRLRI